VTITGTAADITGTLAAGVRFYGPTITKVTAAGRDVAFTRNADGTITVDGGSPITITLTAPADASSATGTITLAATASANAAAVQFLADGRPVGAEDATAPYSLPLDTTQLLNGTHSFAARARTADGATATSQAATVTIANPGRSCATSTAGQPWQVTGFPRQDGQFIASMQATPGDATTVGGIGLGRGVANTWTDLAAIVTFSDDGTVAARDGDHYVSSNVHWTPGQAYLIRLAVDVGTHTYAAYVRPPGATTDTRIGTTLAFRTEQQNVPTLDTLTVPAGIGTVRACGPTLTA
jgi:hypothetical protein